MFLIHNKSQKLILRKKNKQSINSKNAEPLQNIEGKSKAIQEQQIKSKDELFNVEPNKEANQESQEQNNTSQNKSNVITKEPTNDVLLKDKNMKDIQDKQNDNLSSLIEQKTKSLHNNKSEKIQILENLIEFSEIYISFYTNENKTNFKQSESVLNRSPEIRILKEYLKNNGKSLNDLANFDKSIIQNTIYSWFLWKLYKQNLIDKYLCNLYSFINNLDKREEILYSEYQWAKDNESKYPLIF